ncbi:hypothetical protein [Francisella marina]|uniref:hypothetical protein n=1 Tax=Francisella marina TaxID=2249302 RepID=UPI001FEB04FE|nr:hypothetical protein [Francisella marina]
MNNLIKLKYVVLVSIFFLVSNLVYASSCQLIDNQSGYKGFLEFSCDAEISLDDNKIVFYLIGKGVDVDSIDLANADVKYSVDDIAENVKRVSLNISKKTLFIDFDYFAYKDKPVKLKITVKKNSNLNYEVLWGGIVKNSYKIQKSSGNNLQFYRTTSKDIFAIKDGFKCTLDDDCDGRIKLLNQNNLENHKSLQKVLGYLNFGIIYQKLD